MLLLFEVPNLFVDIGFLKFDGDDLLPLVVDLDGQRTSLLRVFDLGFLDVVQPHFQNLLLGLQLVQTFLLKFELCFL